MEKERSAILLVLMLLLICLGWLSVSFYQIPPAQRVATVVAAPTPDTTFVPPGHITIYNSSASGQETYNGSLDVPACDTLGTTLSTTWDNPIHVSIALDVLSYPACTTVGTTTSPFSFSVTKGTATTTPVLGGVTINDKPVTLTLIER